MGIYEFDLEDARRFANELGAKTKVKNGEMLFRNCPYCHGSGKNNEYSFGINLTTGQFKCLRESCHAKGNMLTLARDFDFSLGFNVDEYYRPKRRYRNLRKYPRPITKTPAVEYMESRGISQATTERYLITVRKDNDKVLVFPFYDEEGTLQFIKYRRTDFDKEKHQNKEWCEKDCKPILFGMEQCNPENKTLILTEGQIDSLSVAEAGLENAVSVPTGAKGFTWVPYCWNFLGKFDTLIVFGDHEKGRITLLEEMKSIFRGSVKHVREEDYQDRKDANDLLRKYGKEAVSAAVANAVPVENARIKPLETVKRVDLSQLEKFRTGIPKLDLTLGGLYMGQLIILTGARGEGKSTLASQFAIRAIQAGYGVFFYSGELMDWYFRAWFESQVAGPEYINTKKGNAGEDEYLIRAECIPHIENWYTGKMYLYDNNILRDADGEESETLLETMEDAIKQYGCKVIFLDNLMTAMDDDMNADIYRQQTQFVKKLAVMAKRFDVLIVLIAHPRKTNSAEFSNDDVSGSANITNLADVVLHYGRPKATEQEPDPPDGRLRVTKNRLTGRTEKEINLMYNEVSRRIAEKYAPEAFSWRLGWEEGFESGEDSWMTADDGELEDEIPFDLD